MNDKNNINISPDDKKKNTNLSRYFVIIVYMYLQMNTRTYKYVSRNQYNDFERRKLKISSDETLR